MEVTVESFFDSATFTITYIVFDEKSRDAVVIDPVWDYDQASSYISRTSLRKICDFLTSNNLKLHYILETHIHADHLSGAAELKKIYVNAKTAISKHVIKVQKIFKNIYNLNDFCADGKQFDVLLSDGEQLIAGDIRIHILETPGHTPACVSFLIDDNIFTGDALFMPDYGTGRCDFPGGDARILYDSLQKIYAFPDHYNIYTGHDYQPNGRALQFKTTVGQSKKQNIQIKVETEQLEFVSFRNNRDKNLSAPKLLLPSIFVNMAGGVLPLPESNGMSYLKIPVNFLPKKEN